MSASERKSGPRRVRSWKRRNVRHESVRNEVTTRRMRATNATNASPRAHPGILMPISRYGRGRRFNPYSAHHFSLSNRIASLESQKIQRIQKVSRRTLRLFRCGQSINFLLEFL